MFERAWPVGHKRHAQPAQPRISISREPNPRLMAADDGGKPKGMLNRVHGQHEVSRDAERVPDAQLAEAMEQVLGQVHQAGSDIGRKV